jgi:ABC-type lipopolysaccharide export system ATPase subunit
VKKYKGRSVVKGISVEVNQGEIVGLWDQMAPNHFILYDCGLVKQIQGIYLVI